MALYQIGEHMRLVKTCMPVGTDNAERAAKRVNGMKVAVARMLKRAQVPMDNAAVGVFPCVLTLAEPIVWRRSQQLAMAEAVAQGEWQPLFDHTQPIKDQLQDDDDLFSP